MNRSLFSIPNLPYGRLAIMPHPRADDWPRIPDRGVPASIDEFRRLVHSLDEALAAGQVVAIHCRAGIGRSAVVAAALLVRQGLPLQSALSAVSQARGVSVPDTLEQIEWLQ